MSRNSRNSLRNIKRKLARLSDDLKLLSAPDIVPVLRAMLLDFARKARERESRPIVILIEDRGYGETISVPVVPTLRANGIEFISTSTIVAPNDSGNFVADGHFTSAAFEKIARAVLSSLDRDPRSSRE